jgi:hypothetical protein
MKNGARHSPMFPEALPSMAGSEILVVYDDLASGVRAKLLFDEVLFPLASRGQIRLNMWKFNLLGLPALRAQASRDARHAAMVCIATESADELPLDVVRWVGEWLPEKKADGGAVVLMLGATDAAEASALRSVQFLKNMAGEMHMEFFLHCAEPQSECCPPGLLEPVMEQNRMRRF